MRYQSIYAALLVFPSSIITASLCINDRNYRFGGDVKQSCIWIRNNEEKRQELCSLHADVREACPQACGICCENDSEYTFQIEDEEVRTCEWLARKQKLQKNYCGTYSSGSMVRNACPESCGLCKTEVLAPTGAPSLSNWPTSNPTGMPSTLEPTHAPVSEEDRVRSIEMCEDSTVFRWNGDDKKTCDWIGKNDSRRENLCENDTVAISCPQACRKCCSNDTHYKFSTTNKGDKKCAWLKYDKRREAFCSTVQFGALVANKCPINCGVCEITESPSMSANPTSSPSTSAPTDSPVTMAFRMSSAFESCTDSTSFRWKGDDVKTCNWIARNTKRIDNLCIKDHVALNCPQACRKCCADDDKFRITIPNGKVKTCGWLSRDLNRVKDYCSSVQTGVGGLALVSAKCPLSCQICKNTDSPSGLPTTSASPTSNDTPEPSDIPYANYLYPSFSCPKCTS